MGQGLGAIGNLLFGDPGKAAHSGTFAGAGELGNEFSDFLLNRLNTPIGETDAFKQGSTMLRDQLSQAFATQRQRLGDTANARGFLDSGATIDAETDLARAELGQISQGLNQLFFALENQRTQGILPFLGLGNQEHLGISGMNVQSQTAARYQNAQFVASIFDSLMSPTP